MCDISYETTNIAVFYKSSNTFWNIIQKTHRVAKEIHRT